MNQICVEPRLRVTVAIADRKELGVPAVDARAVSAVARRVAHRDGIRDDERAADCVRSVASVRPGTFGVLQLSF